MKYKQNKKWIIFTYHSPLGRKVTDLFKNTDINKTFKASNTIYQQLAQKADNRSPSGIYTIKCNTCNKNYVGQSGRHITTRHKEHIRYIKTNNLASAYATHILNNRHEYGTVSDMLKLLPYFSQLAKVFSQGKYYVGGPRKVQICRNFLFTNTLVMHFCLFIVVFDLFITDYQL
jgi:hypothetical protein